MSTGKKYLFIVLSFAIAMTAMCVANFIFQIVFIFLDIISRKQSSSLFVLVLWIVTGVFATVFTTGIMEQLTSKEQTSYAETGKIVLIISVIAVVAAILFLSAGQFKKDAEEFSLIFSNGYVLISFFAGAGAMAVVMRNFGR